MSWLDDELKKIRREQELKDQQRTREALERQANAASYEQYQKIGKDKGWQVLSRIVSSLQLRNLMSDARKACRGSKLTEDWGGSVDLNQQLQSAWYTISVGRESYISRSGSQATGMSGGYSTFMGVSITVSYTASDGEYLINLGSGEEVITQQNLAQITARLKTYIAQEVSRYV